jgi:hypothetical protein
MLAQETCVRRKVRRTGIAATAVVFTAAALSLWGSAGLIAPRPRDVTLLYIGADDCGPCRIWQRAERSSFRSSPEFARVTYREVKSPSVFDILKDEYWPADLRPHRGPIGDAAVPLWLVVADDVVVQRAFGASQWHGTVLPKLRALLR